MLLCIKILQSENKITSNEVRFMMVGGTWTETKEKIPEGIPELSNKAWCTICEMDQVLPNFEGIM